MSPNSDRKLTIFDEVCKNLTKDNFKVESAKTGKKYFTGYCKICYYEQTNKARRRREKAKAEERGWL